MLRRTEMMEPGITCGAFAAKLSKVFLSALVLCCSGCFHHKVGSGGFRLEENGGAPILVPTDDEGSGESKFRTSTVVLSGDSAATKNHARDDCGINGEVFSLRAASPFDSKRWVVRSPSVSGWNAVAGQIDVDSHWKSFARGIARMNEEGCFPGGLSSLQIRIAIAQRIPLPADEVPLFFYSDRRIGFADLAPGMQLRLERFVRTAKSVTAEGPPRQWVARYDVISRPGEGVGLKMTGKPLRGSGGELGSEDKELLSLSQRFTHTPVLRLFLEGVYGAGKVSHGMLIGAQNQEQLDALAGLIEQSDPAKCVSFQDTVCTEFPLGSLTLSSRVWIDGHPTSCLFGESLEGCLRSLPPSKRRVTLERAKVFRRVASDRYAQIYFSNHKDGAAQLRLLPGDRIESRH